MKNRISVIAFVMCAGLATSFAAAQPKEHATTTKAPTTKQPEHKADWQAGAQMGPEHIELARALSGEWKATVATKMSPTDTAVTMEGTARFEPVLGARFIKENFESKMDGQPFKGEGYFGFNKATKQFEYTWMDNASTGIMLSTGTKNEKGEIVYTGQLDNPATNQRETVRSVLRFDGTTKMVFEMWSKSSDGTDFKGLEVTYTRQDPKEVKKTITPPVTEKHEAPKTEPTEPKKEDHNK